MCQVKRVKKNDIVSLFQVAKILNTCGKDMALRYDLHHWDNPYIKSLLIVFSSVLKNQVYIVYNNDKPVATFQTKKYGNTMHFAKLATTPSESGHGIGSYCMEMIENMAVKQGCSKVSMEVYDPSSHAISFYENRGYQIVDKRTTLKYLEAVMEKRITGQEK